MGKKKGGKKSSNALEDDDDWAALAEFGDNKEKEGNAEVDKEVKKEEGGEATTSADKGAEGGGDGAQAALTKEQLALKALGLLDEDEGDGKGGGKAAADKKKKKKKKKKGGEGGEAPGPVSAKGKAIAERIRKEKEEEERIAELNRKEEERLKELERQEKEEEERKEREKEEKRKKQKAKIEAQKAAGTYMTKAQKQKAARDAERLEAMKRAGMLVGDRGGGEKGDDGKGAKKKVVYGDRKKDAKAKAKKKKEMEEEEARKRKAEEEEKARREKEEEEARQAKEEEAANEDDGDDVMDDWEDADDSDSDNQDSKDKDSLFDRLNSKLSSLNADDSEKPNFDDEEEEDEIEREKREERERLKQKGLRDKKRREEHEAKLALIAAEEAEANRREMEAQRLREEGKRRREQREKDNIEARSRDNLRCPNIVIMGHVDTGKTKLLDNIRRTNVQEGEAGGITQQIGATYFEPKTLLTRCSKLNETEKLNLTLPGILIIDTPGHESFTNLRSRGSNLCDMAILVVDLMHGMEQQTIESLNMLRSKNTPFVVALNKVDRCYNWKTCGNQPIRDALKQQEEGTVQEFKSRAEEAKTQLQEQGVNSNIYWEMGEDDWMSSDFVPLVPTSAIGGEGVQDILLLLCRMAQEKLWRQLMWCANLQCTVLEVKAIEGLGMTVDVIVVNGTIKENDKVVLCTMDGPVVTEIRGLLTPPPSREMRIKSEYIHHKEVKGALGVKIIGNGLEKVMAGTPLMVVGQDDEEEDIKAEVRCASCPTCL